MKTSVALATFNGENYLEEQLRSIANQTYLPDEVVIVDDVSSDRTREIIEKFRVDAPFSIILEVNEQTLGYTKNFNKALSLTTGDLVFLCDQDDFWFPEKIENIINISKSNTDKLLFINDALIADDQLNYTGETIISQAKKIKGSEKNIVTGCCIAVKREMLDMCLPVAETYPGHDGWLVRFSDALDARQIIEKPLQLYRRHSSNVSPKSVVGTQRSLFGKSVFRIVHFFRRVKEASSDDIDGVIANSQVFLERLCFVAASHDGKFAGNMYFSIDLLKSDLMFLKKRKALRSKNILKRIKLVTAYLIKGYYRRFSGINSAMRDIVG